MEGTQERLTAGVRGVGRSQRPLRFCKKISLLLAGWPENPGGSMRHCGNSDTPYSLQLWRSKRFGNVAMVSWPERQGPKQEPYWAMVPPKPPRKRLNFLANICGRGTRDGRVGCQPVHGRCGLGRTGFSVSSSSHTLTAAPGGRPCRGSNLDHLRTKIKRNYNLILPLLQKAK